MAVDTLSLLGVIGTWLAVVLAILALIGIVGPLLVIKAFYSDKNQALNSIRDLRGDYITRGIGIGRSFRIFHRVKVPRLVPLIDWDNLDGFRIPSPDQSWELGRVQSTTCRTGWAGLCRLLSAYDVPLERDGELVIDGTETCLPVSKYYILSIGLLGRYGERDDGGKVFNANPLRPDLCQMRLLTSDIERIVHLDRERQREDTLGSGSGSESGSEGEEEEEIESSTEDDVDTDVSSMHENMKLGNYICGVTGEMRVNSNSDSQRYYSSEDTGFTSAKEKSVLKFTLHHEQEMGRTLASVVDKVEKLVHDTGTKEGDYSKASDLPLTSLYWLASGFLPLTTKPNVVACLQTPPGIVGVDLNATGFGYDSDSDDTESEPDAAGSAVSEHRRRKRHQKRRAKLKNWTAIKLEETHERPISIFEASATLGIASTRILMFHSITKEISTDLSEVAHLRALANKEISSGTSKWIVWKPRWGESCGPVFLLRKDVQMLVWELLTMEWHPWSYLIWKQNNKFWLHIMRGSVGYLDHENLKNMLRLWKKSPQEWKEPWAVRLREWLYFAGRNVATHEQRRHTALLGLHQALKSRLRKDGSSHVLALLFIGNQEFREKFKLDAKLEVEVDLKKRAVLVVSTSEVPKKSSKRRKSSSFAKEEHISYDKGSKRNYVEKKGTDTIVVTESQEKHFLTERLELGYDDVFSFTFGAENSEKAIKIEQEDLFIATTWAATCCALWTSAINSGPLMEILNRLDDTVHVF